MKKTILLLFVLDIVCIGALKGSNDNYPFGARAAGMGNAAVTLYDFWAISHNQAGLAQQKSIAAGVYFENRFMVNELSLGAVAVAYPASTGVFGVNFSYFGYELYNETKIGLAYAREFGERFSAGLQLNYHYTVIGEDYGNKGSLTFELGSIFQLMPHLTIGAHIFNPGRAKIGDFADERIPTIIRTGISYTFSDKVIVVLETEKSINHAPVVKAGIEYRIIDFVFVRGGIATRPTSNSFGFGIIRNNFSIDFATSFHYILGYSPQLSIVYYFKK